MIKITNLRLPPLSGEAEIRAAAAKRLHISADALTRVALTRSSIDARRGHQPAMVCSLLVECANESALLRKSRDRSISAYSPPQYIPPIRLRQSSKRPVVVGLGPAGLFAALYLARAGIPCLVLERGEDIDSRTHTVETSWKTGKTDRESNVQFGEGGAGAFSDGKLTTGTHDGRITAVLETLHQFGAPEDILWSHKPHIGTDILRQVVRAIRLELIRLGCEVRFGHRMTGLHFSEGVLTGVTAESSGGSYTADTDAVVLAIGHSARDSFAMLAESGLELIPKPFAMGVRIEHRQKDISAAQFGPLHEQLPPADYKLAEHLENGRSVFSFCVCPGGVVVASASGDGEIVTNGMSYRARDGENINGALLVNVTPDDFDGADPLAGVRFQHYWEQKAFALGGGRGYAPAQTVGDFLSGTPSAGAQGIEPSYRPGVTWTDLSKALPGFVTESLRLALPRFGKKVRGFDAPAAVLTGIESRSSSPLRIQRGTDFCATRLQGLYPCGEGAGYAGGIVSAAVDGIRIAEAIITKE